MSMTDSQNSLGQLMQLGQGAELAVHVYLMTLEKDDRSIQYATIIETHHPDYMTESALLKLYALDQAQRISPADLARLLDLVEDQSASAAF